VRLHDALNLNSRALNWSVYPLDRLSTGPLRLVCLSTGPLRLVRLSTRPPIHWTAYPLVRLDRSANAPDPTPPKAHIVTPTTQSVHSIEACYKTPVGHFHVEQQEAHKKVEVQHPRHVKPKTGPIEEASRPEITTDTNEGEAKRGVAGGIGDP
jgi:hypothetical protein